VRHAASHEAAEPAVYGAVFAVCCKRQPSRAKIPLRRKQAQQPPAQAAYTCALVAARGVGAEEAPAAQCVIRQRRRLMEAMLRAGCEKCAQYGSVKRRMARDAQRQRAERPVKKISFITSLFHYRYCCSFHNIYYIIITLLLFVSLSLSLLHI